ncbi:hypothetical protein CsSME_00039368 [Camellia sinensis var. sinensis]
MAEAILFNLASKVVEKIGSLALREVGLAWGLEDELKTLEARVSMIKAVLVDADQKQQQQQQGNNNLVISLWLERLEAAFYEADNVLDEFHYEPRSLKSQMFNGKSADECVQITKRTAKREVTGFQCTINRGMACI